MSDRDPNPNPGSVTIPLTKPIQAHGENLFELVLRRPTVKELRECGQPYVIVLGSGGGGVQSDYAACARLIGAICGIPPSSVDQLDSADFDEVAILLLGFTKRAALAATA